MADWPSDKELEEIYRKGSENHDFQYSDEAWNEMELLLDKEKKRRSIIIFFTLIGFVFALGLFYFNTTYNPVLISDSMDANDARKVLETSNSIEQLSDKIAKKDLVANHPTQEKTESIDFLSKEPQNLSNSKNLNSRVPETSNGQNSNNSSLKTAKANQDPIEQNSDGNNEETKIGSVQSGNLEPAIIAVLHNEINQENIPLIDLLTIKSFVIDHDHVHQKPNTVSLPNQDKKQFSKFFIGSILGVESSWTPNGEFSSIDGSFGIKINHLLNKHLAITLGGSFVKDVYVAHQGDYKASKDFWKATGAPEYTKANCNMIELSTGFSYYFKGIDKRGFSTSVNLISNFMLKEDYYYHFTEENNNFSSSWTMENNTWLNAIDLAANYKFDLSDKWSIEIGPYIKIPIAGIGHGDVMLSSFGLRILTGIRLR